MINRRKLATFTAAALAMPFIRPARAAIRVRLAIAHPLADQMGTAAMTLAEVVRTGSDGRIHVEVFANGSLGSEVSTLAAVRAGAIDLTIFASGLLGVAVPEIGLLDMPFLFRDAARARIVLDGPIGREYAEACNAQGIPVLGWAENGVRHLTANRPIRNAADLKGLKLRVMPAPLLRNSFEAMGATVGVLAYEKVYEALRIGEFDAQENPIASVISAHFYEVQSHLILTAHTYSAACVIASPDLLEDLKPSDRRLFETAAHAAVLSSRAFNDEADRTGVEWLRGRGMTVISNPDHASFRRAAIPAEAAAAALFGADRIGRLRASE